MIPGEIITCSGEIELNAGRTNTLNESGFVEASIAAFELLTCEPAKVLPLAQRYFLF